MRSPFPNNIAFTCLHANSDLPISDLLLPAELSLLSPLATENRLLQFGLGRKAARTALQALAIKPVPILQGQDRAPIWPDGIVGSISHSTNRAVAVAAHSKDYLGIGIDLESIRNSALNVLARIASPEEQSWVAGDLLRATTLFSAKESIFKALHPIHKQPMGFLDVIFHAGVVELQRDFLPFRKGQQFKLLIQYEHGLVLTGVVITSK